MVFFSEYFFGNTDNYALLMQCGFGYAQNFATESKDFHISIDNQHTFLLKLLILVE